MAIEKGLDKASSWSLGKGSPGATQLRFPPGLVLRSVGRHHDLGRAPGLNRSLVPALGAPRTCGAGRAGAAGAGSVWLPTRQHGSRLPAAMGICSRASAGDLARARAAQEISALRDAQGTLRFWWLLEELQPTSLTLVLHMLEKFLPSLHWN